MTRYAVAYVRPFPKVGRPLLLGKLALAHNRCVRAAKTPAQGMGLNWLLGSPRGRLNLQGSSRDVTYAFTIVREGPNGTRVEPLPADFERDVKGVGKKPSPEIIKKWAGQVRRPIADGPAEVMVPGPK